MLDVNLKGKHAVISGKLRQRPVCPFSSAVQGPVEGRLAWLSRYELHYHPGWDDSNMEHRGYLLNPSTCHSLSNMQEATLASGEQLRKAWQKGQLATTEVEHFVARMP